MPSYNRGKMELTRKQWLTTAIKCMLLKDTYAPDIDAHQVYGDIGTSSLYEIPTVSGYTPGGVLISGKSVVQDNGADASLLKADNVAFGALGIGATIGFAALYIDHATPSEKHLLSYYVLPSTPTNGVQQTVNWGASGACLRYQHLTGTAVFFNRGKRRVSEANWETQVHRLAFLRGGGTPYVPDLDAHQVWGDISSFECAIGAPYVAGGATMDPALDAAKRSFQVNDNDRGECRASDIAFGSLPTATDPIRYMVLYEHHATDGAQRHLVAYFDVRISGQDVPTNGTNVNVKWPGGVVLRIGHVS